MRKPNPSKPRAAHGQRIWEQKNRDLSATLANAAMRETKLKARVIGLADDCDLLESTISELRNRLDIAIDVLEAVAALLRQNPPATVEALHLIEEEVAVPVKTRADAWIEE